MGVQDVKIIGVGKDAYNDDLNEMVDGRILPWTEDAYAENYPVWNSYGAEQRFVYFFNRNGDLIHQFDITSLDPESADDYEYLLNLILDYRSGNGPNVIKIPEDTQLIQSGIDIAQDGDIVLVYPGVYYENISFLNKNITLSSLLYSGVHSSEYQPTIIDGSDSGSVVTINGDQTESTILIGFTIQNGWATVAGGGIYIEDASPIIDRNIIKNNHAGDCGGTGAGIAIMNESSPLIMGNQFMNNEVSGYCDCICYFGGGIYVDETSWPIVGSTISETNIFLSNSADFGFDLFRSVEGDTTNWTPIYAQHNGFEYCPPNETLVFPANGWDVENCYSFLDVDVEPKDIPDLLTLYPNYPNPFNPLTTIKFSTQSNADVTIQIFDINGRTIESKILSIEVPGNYESIWNASQFPSGLYFIQIKNDKFSQTQKAILVK